MQTENYEVGALVRARGRDWMVVGWQSPLLTLRPLGGGEQTIIHEGLEGDTLSSHELPPPTEEDIGEQARARMLADAMRLKLQDGVGPFRSLGRLSFTPRLYQYVPLLMALQQKAPRLLIADDVGIGKTIEAGMILRELMDRGEAPRAAVLCPPHLCEQWRAELRQKFNIEAELVTSALAERLERRLPPGDSLFRHFSHTVVSLDFVKTERRRAQMLRDCPDFVIVDEAHTRAWRGGGRHHGYELLRGLANKPDQSLVLLSATPHSGSDDAFFNLLGLLNEKFCGLKEAKGNERRRLRDSLAQHFVQRRRPDIKRDYGGKEEQADFPEKISQDMHYLAQGTPFGDLLNSAIGYCRELKKQMDENGDKDERARRVTYWSLLALMTCVSSSPQAALQALANREQAPQEEPEEEDAEETAQDDLPPALALEENAALKALKEKAEALVSGKAEDPKLKRLEGVLDGLLQGGRSPIVFCHYIATAHYVQKKLQERFKEASVFCVTGENSPEQRAQAVAKAGEAKKRVLVATDCLAEGVNLQEHFNAVVHYDLLYNPVRHQQREGRIDRYGQPSETVHAVMLYAKDNPVDNAILQVIIKKAEKIRRELGVPVPLPNAGALAKTLLGELIWGESAARGRQGELIDMEKMPEAARLNAEWEKEQDKAREKQRTIFSQSKIRPEDVLPERNEALKALGGASAVRRFARSVFWQMGMQPKSEGEQGDIIVAQYASANSHVTPELKKWLKPGANKFCFDRPAADAELLHRAHPLVRHLAEYVAETALKPGGGFAARAGAMFGNVDQLVVVAILRLRHRLQAAERKTPFVAEEVAVVRLQGGKMTPDEGALQLLEADAVKNMPQSAKRRWFAKAMQELEAQAPAINAFAKKRAAALRESHERARGGAQKTGNIANITKAEHLPPSTMGVYVVVPSAQ